MHLRVDKAIEWQQGTSSLQGCLPVPAILNGRLQLHLPQPHPPDVHAAQLRLAAHQQLLRCTSGNQHTSTKRSMHVHVTCS